MRSHYNKDKQPNGKGSMPSPGVGLPRAVPRGLEVVVCLFHFMCLCSCYIYIFYMIYVFSYLNFSIFYLFPVLGPQRPRSARVPPPRLARTPARAWGGLFRYVHPSYEEETWKQQQQQQQ